MSHITRNAAAHQAHEDYQADDAAAQDAAEKHAFAELQVSFLLALEGGGETPVPHPVTDYALVGFLPRHELPWTLKHQPVINAVFDALCNSKGCDNLLMAMLGASKCPLAVALKKRLAEEFAEMYCPGLAQIDLQTADSI